MIQTKNLSYTDIKSCVEYECPGCGEETFVVLVADRRLLYFCNECDRFYSRDELKRNKKW